MALGNWLFSLRARNRKHSARRKSGYRRLLVESLGASRGLRPRLARGEILEDRRLLSAIPAMVKDIFSGADGSDPWDFTMMNGTLFFAADDGGASGTELWKSDGTVGNAVMVKDINTVGASSGSFPEQLTDVGGTLFFAAEDGSGNGPELWKSDGSVGNANKILYGVNGIASPEQLTDVNGTLFFVADAGSGPQLWKCTTAGVATPIAGTANTSPDQLTNVNGTLFFAADNGLDGNELWKYNGTVASMVANINPAGSSDPAGLTDVNGTLFFAADDGANGMELWKSDGTTTVMVRDIGVGGEGSDPSFLTNMNGKLYFSADDGVRGAELWKSDGTESGTVLLKDITRGINSSDPANLTNVNGTLFLSADDGSRGVELWMSDGTTAGTVIVKDINPSGDSSPSLLTDVNGTLFFIADDGTHGMELWKSDGTSATAGHTILAKDIWLGSSDSSPDELIGSGETLFFAADDGANGRELWKAGAFTKPVLSGIPGTTLVYKAGQSADPVANAIVVTDDRDILSAATIQISTNYQPGDVLKFKSTSTIRGKWDATTGTLTLKGIDTKANYQTALRSVSLWKPTVAGLRTVTFTPRVGSIIGDSVTRDVYVGNVPAVTMNAPDTSPLTYTEEDGAVAVASLVTLNDADSADLIGATIQISKNYVSPEDELLFANMGPITGSWNSLTGTLTLSGTDTVSNYEAALQSVEYWNHSENPSSVKRTVTFTVKDNTVDLVVDPLADDTALTSNVASRIIAVKPVNDAPVLSAIGADFTYVEDTAPAAITSTINVDDVDNVNLSRATIQITDGYVKGQDRLAFTNTPKIRGAWRPMTGTLTLSGSDTVANYQTALRAVTFTTGADPGADDRTVEIQVSDGKDLSNTESKVIHVTPVNDAPVLAKVESSVLAYRVGQAAALVTRSIRVSDADNTELTGATVQITGNYNAGDLLSFPDMGIGNITVLSWNPTTGTLTLSGDDTLANYQLALRSVRFSSTSSTAAVRTVTFQANDGSLANNLSNTLTRNINVTL